MLPEIMVRLSGTVRCLLRLFGDMLFSGPVL